MNLIESLRTGSHPDSANAKLADLAEKLASSLEEVLSVFHRVASPSNIDKEYYPPEHTATGRALKVLREAGRLPND